MPESNWNSIARTWIALSTFLVIVAGYVTLTELRKAEPSVADEYEASRYFDRAQDRIDRICIDLSGVELLHCEYEVEQPERENYRAQKDLRAQWYMAIWAGFMTVFTLGTLIVTSLGVYFVRLTLVQADRTNSAAVDAAIAANRANEIMLEDRRPWLLPMFEIVQFDVGQSNIGFQISCSMKNSGERPAFHVNFDFRIFGGVSRSDPDYEPRFWLEHSNRRPEGNGSGSLVLPGGEMKIGLFKDFPIDVNTSFAAVEVSVIYFDRAGTSPYQFATTFNVNFPTPRMTELLRQRGKKVMKPHISQGDWTRVT